VQQVADAVGTALLITIMSNGVQDFLRGASIDARAALAESSPAGSGSLFWRTDIMTSGHRAA
jgi:hypothetical protein